MITVTEQVHQSLAPAGVLLKYLCVGLITTAWHIAGAQEIWSPSPSEMLFLTAMKDRGSPASACTGSVLGFTKDTKMAALGLSKT